MRNPPKKPVLADPTRIPLAGKLRLKEGTTVALLHAPAGFRKKLDPLPKGVRFTAAAADAGVVLLFVKSAAELGRELPSLVGQVTAGQVLWVIWPKKASGVPSDLTMPAIFEICSTFGVAAHKTCAVDQTWSGLAVGKARRVARAFIMRDTLNLRDNR